MRPVLAIRCAPLLIVAHGCFNPDDKQNPTSTSATIGTIGTVEDSSASDPSTDPDDDVGPSTTPESDTVGDASTGDCTAQGCFCITDDQCDDGLVCRADACEPLVCGDGVAEGTEQCDDMNRADGDGCDVDCTYTELLQVAASYRTTCLLIEGGRVRCWGFGGDGALGQGNQDMLGDDEPAYEVDDIMLPLPANTLTSGDYHNCALMGDDDLPMCWGRGSSGQLGQVGTYDIGDDEFPSELAAIDVGGGVLQIAAGGQHTCTRMSVGTLRCWGAGFGGALGYGNTNSIGDDEPPSAAGNVPVGSALNDLAAGINHTCGILSNGLVRCWGAGYDGQLGYGNTNTIGDDETAEAGGVLDFGEEAIDISCGLSQSCAVFESGAVRCWGQNGFGELGQAHVMNIGDDEPATMLPPIDLGGMATSITVGDNHACVIIDDGSVRCWGLNSEGQLGLGHIDNLGDDEAPSVAGALDFGEGQPHQVEVGGTHSCVILDRRRLKCWGSGAVGQLGHGTIDNLGDDEPLADVPDVPVFGEN